MTTCGRVAYSYFSTISYNPSSTGAGTIDHDWILVNVSASDNLELAPVSEQFDGSNASFANSVGDHYWTNHTGLADGTYTVKGFAADTAGNTGSTGEREVTVDTTANLSITAYSPENTTYTTDTIDIEVTADIAVDTWKYRLDSGSNTTFQPNTTISGLSDGTHTVDVYANSTDGDTDSKSVTFTVDTSDSGGGSDPDTEPAYFDVNITETNSPVTEGEILNVTADIENTGDESDTQTVVLEIDGEQEDSTLGTLSGGQSTSITFTYVTEDGDAGDRTATVASDDDTDSTTVTIEAADDTSDGGDSGDGSDTSSGGSSSSTSDDDDLSNVTVSSALEELPIGTVTTGSVLAENPHGANATLQIASTMDASCDYIRLVDKDEWGMAEYELPANTTQRIGYEINLTGLDAGEVELTPGDTITCEYDVTVPDGDDTAFEITAEIRSPGLFPGLTITGLTGQLGGNRGPIIVGIVLVLAFGAAWWLWL